MTSAPPLGPKRVLNVGSGDLQVRSLHPAFHVSEWREVRLDVDPKVRPDIVCSSVDMRAHVETASFDAVFSSHCIEHLHTYEVAPALLEMKRVLRPGGFCLLTCPDLQAIAELVVAGLVEDPVYHSPVGPIRPLDMLFGHSASIARGDVWMAHNTGFTAPRLARAALAAGFSEVRVSDRSNYELWAVLLTPGTNAASLAKLFAGTNIACLFEPQADLELVHPSQVEPFERRELERGNVVRLKA